MPLPVADAPLFFLDYDGTLAPIVDDPKAAVPHPDVPALLETLDARYPLWIVTGRDIDALSRFLDLPLKAIGLHGAQEGVVGGEVKHLMTDEAAESIAALRQSVPDVDGLNVEDKDRAFAVHYREADEAEAHERLRAWIDTMPDLLDAIWGKQVVELRPEGLTKGTAVRRIADRFPERTPVYLGDDVTDEDAFDALHALDRPAVTVKVGDGDTEAHHRLNGPDDVVAYLKQYAGA
jgi:trehalose 6-phosphate phosphatase